MPARSLYSFYSRFTVFALVAALASSVEAVTFRIVDAVAAPGAATARLHLIVDPEGANIDGVQFGVEVDSGASITSIALENDFLELVAAAGGSPAPKVTPSPVGSGFTFILDLDDDNLARFSGSTAFPVAEIEVTFTVPPTAGQTFDVSLTSNLGVQISYTTGAVAHTVVTTVDGILRTGDQQRDFDVAGPADLFSAGNWTPSGAPQQVDDLFVRNGGTAEATDGDLAARSLRVGDTLGDGTVTMTGTGIRIAQDLEVGGHRDEVFTGMHDFEGSVTLSGGTGIEAPDVSVAQLPLATDAEVTAVGSLNIQQVDEVTALNNIFIAEINDDSGRFSGTTASATATLNIEQVSSLTVGTDLTMSSISGDAEDSTATVSADSTVTLSNIGEILIGDDIRGADRLCNTSVNQAGSRDMDVNLTVANIGLLRLGSDIRLTDGSACAGAETHTAMATASFSDIEQLIVGDDIEFPSFGWIRSSTVTDLDGTWDFTRINHFFVRSDFEVGMSRADDLTTGTLTSTHAVSLTETPTLEIGGRFRIGAMTLFDQPDMTASADVDASFTVSNAAITVGSHLLVGVVFQDDPDTGSGVPDAMSGLDISGALTLSRSSLQVPLAWIGVVEQGLLANPSGRVALSGFLGTNLLEVGENGTLVLQIEGDNPASALTVGQARAAQVAAADALIEGTVQVEFLYTPADGVHTYDLMVAPAGTLADTTGVLEVTALPDGFIQRSFGIVTDGALDVLRLEIEGPVLFSDGFESGDTSAWSSSSP